MKAEINAYEVEEIAVFHIVDAQIRTHDTEILRFFNVKAKNKEGKNIEITFYWDPDAELSVHP